MSSKIIPNKVIDDGSKIIKYHGTFNIDDVIVGIGLNNRERFQIKEQKELKKSIRKRGPFEDVFISVRKDGKPYLLAGERRFRAQKSLGHKKIDAFYAKNLTSEQESQITIDENIHLPIPKINDAMCMFETYKDVVSKRLNIPIDNLIGIDNYFDLISSYPEIQKGYSIPEFAKASGLSSDATRKAFYASNAHDFLLDKCCNGEIPYSVLAVYGRVQNKNEQMILHGMHGHNSKDISKIRLAVSEILEKKKENKKEICSDDLLFHLMGDGGCGNSNNVKSSAIYVYEKQLRNSNTILDFLEHYVQVVNIKKEILSYGTILEDKFPFETKLNDINKELTNIKTNISKKVELQKHLERIKKDIKKESLDEILEKNGVNLMDGAVIEALNTKTANIIPDKTQPRKVFPKEHLETIEHSMESVGQITNVLCYVPHKDGTPLFIEGKKCYQLIAGHCRDKSRQMVGRNILIAKVLDYRKLTSEIIRAIQREEHKLPLTRGERAVGYAKIYDILEKEYKNKHTNKPYTFEMFYRDTKKRKIRVPKDLGRDIAFVRLPKSIRQLEFTRRLSFSQTDALSVLFNRMEEGTKLNDDCKFAMALDVSVRCETPEKILLKYRKKDKNQLEIALDLCKTKNYENICADTYKLLNSSFLENLTNYKNKIVEIQNGLLHSDINIAKRYVYLYFKVNEMYEDLTGHVLQSKIKGIL